MILRPISRVVARPQRRTFLDWMVNYPDRINELKKIHQAGGRSVPTWCKQPGDEYVLMFGAALFAYGMAQTVVGHYRLATGTGKME